VSLRADHLFGLPFVAFGVFALVAGVRNTIDAANSAEWAVTSGEVVISEVVRHHGGGTSGRSGAIDRPGSPASTTYEAHVEYRYSVAGETHDGDRVTYANEDTAEWAEATVHEYPTGARVEVHYDPRDPSRSVLEPGESPNTVLLSVGGVGLIVLGVFVARWKPNAR
jgi:hypothetical protein